MIVPQGKASESFLELARTPKTQGRLFRKHILSEGTLHYKGKKIEVDSNFLNTLVKNFNDKKCDIVQVPIVGDNNNHTEDPERNIGEVVDLSIENGKLYSYIDARKETAAEELGKTLLGASAMLATNYEDTSSGELVGPTLLHVAVTNRPHVLNLDDFEEVIAASSQSTDEVILLSEESEETSENTDPKENLTMDRETLIATLKDEHGIDLSALQAEIDTLKTENTNLTAEFAKKEELAVSLSNVIKESFEGAGLVKLSSDADGDQVEELIATVTEAGVKLSAQNDEIVTLSGRVDSLEADKAKASAEVAVDELVRAGKLLPVQREAMVELKLSNSELFDKIVPEKAIIDLSKESGVDDDTSTNPDVVSEEVARLRDLN
jgi:hypothetical protein